MFETAEVGRKVSKDEFKERSIALREDLLRAQDDLREAGFPVLVVFAGVDGAGKGETVNTLNEWMDPRWIKTCAFDDPSDEERERPIPWRFWRRFPPKGQIGLYLRAWYSRPIMRRVEGGSEQDFDVMLDTIAASEKAIADDGAVIIKFWMHLGKKQQKKRLKDLESDPLQSWRVTKQDWANYERYQKFIDAAETTISKTSQPEAPWHIIEGEDAAYRSLRVGELLLAAIVRRLEEKKRTAALEESREADQRISEEPVPSREQFVTILTTLDMKQELSKSDYKKELAEWQGRLNLLDRKMRAKGIASVLAFEGWDAAGKGGIIRRITGALDARWIGVYPIAAPTEEEKEHHYLWRFWRQVPRAGHMAIFDRSWYGRVLVERVEGFAREERWRAAYSEINAFEQQLVDGGVVVAKFWVHITPDEQERRFKERQETPYKRWKLTAEDWRNRERWDDYQLAVHEMVERTSTHTAPWTLVEGNNKRFARIKVLKTVCERLENALESRKKD
jgi:AMP-polyphosphate phosphotransferase